MCAERASALSGVSHKGDMSCLPERKNGQNSGEGAEEKAEDLSDDGVCGHLREPVPDHQEAGAGAFWQGCTNSPIQRGRFPEKRPCLIWGSEKRKKNAFSMEPLPPAKHIFTHVEWHMTGYHIALSGSDSMEAERRAGRLEKRTGGRFVTGREGAEMYAVPGAFQAYMQVAQSLV